MSVLTVSTGFTLSQAIAASAAGDVINVPAGVYVEDFPLITHSLTIQGVGGFAHLMAPGNAPGNTRAILFVEGFRGADLTVRNLEFSGATGPYNNAAGILFEYGNGDIVIENSWFHDNQNGVLIGGYPGTEVTIDRSEFGFNGLPPSNPFYGRTHNIYINDVDRVTITNSYFHDALGGHEIKSRARETIIANNRIQDGPTSDTSYSIDIPNAGIATITGNVIEKGASAVNRHVVHFGGEGSYPTNSQLTLADNLIVNNRSSSTALFNQTDAGGGQSYPVTVTGNTLYNVEELYRTFYPAAGNVFAGNVMLSGPAPALDTSAPWATPEPMSGGLLGVALLLVAARKRCSFLKKRTKKLSLVQAG